MGRFVVENTVEIDAPVHLVWQVLVDLPRYGEWNPFVRECRSSLKPGDPIDMQVQMGERVIRQREWMRSFDEGRGFGYAMQPVPFSLSSGRTHLIEALGEGRCRYSSHLHLDGWARHVVVAMMGEHLRAGFAGMTAALKARAEQLAAEQGE